MANIKSFPNNQDVYIGAEDVMKWLHGRTSGVFAAGENASVSALVDPTMAVAVSDGNGWMSNKKGDGIVWWNDHETTNGTKLQINIDPADGVLNRIDRIIVEWKTTNYVDYPEVKVLKGSLASTAVAPALTNNSTLRQISLAQVFVAAGTTAITASMVTDERLDASVCGLVTESISIDTSVMQNQFEALLKAIQNELLDLEAGTGVELKKLQFNNTSVAVADFVEDTTYEDYPFRAAVPLEGVIDSMIPEIIFSLSDATSGLFAPVAESYNGGVYLYASDVPEANVTVPVIICWKGNA
jgi:hypothetical protein